MGHICIVKVRKGNVFDFVSVFGEFLMILYFYSALLACFGKRRVLFDAEIAASDKVGGNACRAASSERV